MVSSRSRKVLLVLLHITSTFVVLASHRFRTRSPACSCNAPTSSHRSAPELEGAGQVGGSGIGTKDIIERSYQDSIFIEVPCHSIAPS